MDGNLWVEQLFQKQKERQLKTNYTKYDYGTHTYIDVMPSLWGGGGSM